MKRLLLTASIAGLLLSACAPKSEVPAGADAAAGEAASGEETAVVAAEDAPLPADLGSPAFEEVTEDYEIRTVVDPEIVDFDPSLAKLFFDVAQESLDALKEQAVNDRKSADEDAAADGRESWFHQYSLEYRFEATARAGDVISVQQNVYSFTGGAHPNYSLKGMVYQQGRTDPVPLSEVVADMPAFGAALKAGLVEEKLERGYEVTREGVISEVNELLGDDQKAGSESGANFVLEPSTEEGRFGGISVLFSPYDVGPYAEGAYTITIPAADLASITTTEWAPRFGGEPVLREGGGE